MKSKESKNVFCALWNIVFLCVKIVIIYEVYSLIPRLKFIKKLLIRLLAIP